MVQRINTCQNTSVEHSDKKSFFLGEK